MMCQNSSAIDSHQQYACLKHILAKKYIYWTNLIYIQIHLELYYNLHQFQHSLIDTPTKEKKKLS